MGVYRFKLPDIGEGVVEAEITAWHVKVGETVEEDQAVADAMTDKATIELTAPVDGVVKTLACDEGEMLAVGADLIVFQTEGGAVEDEPAPEPEKPAASAPETASQEPVPQKPKKSKPVPANSNRKPAPSKPSKTTGKVLASPAVRRRAKEAGLDLSLARPTGEDGHITQSDLDLLEKTLTPIAGEERIKVIGLRRVIAYVYEVDITPLGALRGGANARKREDRPKLTVLPFIIRALAITFRDWPQFNARYMDEQGFVSRFSGLHLGIATQTDNGLIVPVLKNADRLSVWDISGEIARLAQGVRENRLGKEDLFDRSHHNADIARAAGRDRHNSCDQPAGSRHFRTQ